MDGIYVNQPKRFLPLAKEAKKLAEEFRKEEVASLWAGTLHEKLLQASFVAQLNSLQSLDQLAPPTAAKEHLPKDIINILELLGKADNILFNQLYNLAEDCVDRYYCYIVGLGLNCKFIDLLFKCSVIKFIKISSHLDFIVSEIIYNQTDTLTQRLMYLR